MCPFLLLLAFQSPLSSADLESMHANRRAAASTLLAALAERPASETPAWRRARLARLAEELSATVAGDEAAAGLRAAGRIAAGAPSAAAGARLLDATLGVLASDLGFLPVAEAPVPAGYPAPTPVGELVVLRYPDCRIARTPLDRMGGAFWRLLLHIEGRGIAMTAPVQTDYAEARADGASQPSAMAFLYDRPERGARGAAGEVEVLDQPAVTVLSLGGRGWADRAAVEAAERRLRAVLAAPDAPWRAAGPLRVLEYNSPAVRGPRRFHEVQIPVEPARPPAPADLKA
jgi:hypothetical protein